MCGWAVSALSLLGATPAAPEELFSHLTEAQDQPGAYLAISPCTGEDIEECVVHSLSCGERLSHSFEFNVIVGPVERIVQGLVVGTDGNATATIGLSEGATKVGVRLSSVDAVVNELDGGWMLALGSSDTEPFFDALTLRSAEGATITVAGETFSLAPQRGSGADLVRWRDACVRLRGY